MLDIITYPNPILRQRSEEVEEIDDALRKFLDEMVETMYVADGVGLAAPQVAVSKRIFVFDVNPEARDPQILINPVIVSKSKETAIAEEGCLSVPEITGNVKRPVEIRVEGLNELGEDVSYEGGELLARCIQHELDHLDGILFIDKLSTAAKFSLRRELKRRDEAFKSLIG